MSSIPISSSNQNSTSAYLDALNKIFTLASSRHSSLRSLPTIASPETLSRGIQVIENQLPDQGWGLKKTIDYLFDEILPTLSPGQNSSRYFGFVTGGTTPISQLSDFLTTIFDSNVQVHLPKETLSTLIEAHTIKLLLELLSLPVQKFTGTITTGATSSNILGLACARESVLRHLLSKPNQGERFSFSEEGFSEIIPPINVFVACSHASIKKAAALVGIGRSRVKDLGSGKKYFGVTGHEKEDQENEDDRQYLAEKRAECLDFDLELLESELKKSKELKQGSIVIIGIGEVNTGFISQQTPKIKELCLKYDSWLHIDAAFSAFISLLDGKEWISEHMSLADSITSDGHKALNVPYDSGLFFVKRTREDVHRHESELEEVLGNGKSGAPAYLATSNSIDQNRMDGDEDEDEALEKAAYAAGIPSPLVRNIENSRRFRALPLFASLLSFGRSGFKSMTSRNVEFARKVANWMREDPIASKCYSIMTPKSLPVTTVILFRANPLSCPIEEFKSPSDGHALLTTKIKETREMYVTQTSWSGFGAVRLAVSNWATGFRKKDWDGEVEEDLEDGEEDFRIVKAVLLRVMGKE